MSLLIALDEVSDSTIEQSRDAVTQVIESYPEVAALAYLDAERLVMKFVRPKGHWRHRHSPIVLAILGRVFVGAGETDRALDLLERATAAGVHDDKRFWPMPKRCMLPTALTRRFPQQRMCRPILPLHTCCSTSSTKPKTIVKMRLRPCEQHSNWRPTVPTCAIGSEGDWKTSTS